MSVKVSDLGEFELIARLKEELGGQQEAKTVQGKLSRLLIGIGDDAAVWRSPSTAQIATTDTLVADVHFPSGRIGWNDLGWKALAVNVSDIAAMGGSPEYALVTLALPADFLVEDVIALYQGMMALGRDFGVVIAGGDIVRSNQTIISIALWGSASKSPRGEPLLLTRDAAQLGDAVAVSGSLGNAAGGLRLLMGARSTSPAASEYLRRAHLRPQPQIELGRALVGAGVRCAIDVSDGLARDLRHICEESRLGAIVHTDKLPVSEQLLQTFPDDALSLVVSGGEDYELLFTGPIKTIDQVRSRFPFPITVIGEMVEDGAGSVRFVDDSGGELAFESPGWDHFAQRPGDAALTRRKR